MEIKRKGIIFALDAALAVSVVIIILINSSYYFSTSSKESLSQLQPVRIGSDIIAVLDYQEKFDYTFANDLELHGDVIPESNLNVSVYLPKNYAMYYTITDMKETPVTVSYCPDGGGTGAQELCQTSTGVDCNANGCTLDQAEWIKIKPFTLLSEEANIINQGNHFVMLGTTRSDPGISATINVDGNFTTQQFPFDLDTGIYFWGSTFVFPYFESGNSSNNWITVTNNASTSLTLKWIRVVGDTSYSRGAYSDNTITSIPIDRFIGSGERFISILEPDGDFAGYHLVSYWIWLKTAGS